MGRHQARERATLDTEQILRLLVAIVVGGSFHFGFHFRWFKILSTQASNFVAINLDWLCISTTCTSMILFTVIVSATETGAIDLDFEFSIS